MIATFSALLFVAVFSGPDAKATSATDDQKEIARLQKLVAELIEEKSTLAARVQKAEKQAEALADENDRLRANGPNASPESACAAEIEALFREIVRRGRKPSRSYETEQFLLVADDVIQAWTEDRPGAKAVFGKAHDFLKDWLGARRNHVDVDAPDDLPPVYAGPAPFRQILNSTDRVQRLKVAAEYVGKGVLWRGKVAALVDDKNARWQIEFIADDILVRATLHAPKKGVAKGVRVGENVAVRGTIEAIEGTPWTGIEIQLSRCTAEDDPRGTAYPPWPGEKKRRR